MDAALDDEVHRFEVVEGSLVVSPPPTAFHQRVGRRLFVQLHEQVPATEWEAVYEEYVRLAGIPHYWIVETEPDVLLVAHDLVSGAYREVARVGSGTADLPGPVPLRVDVDALR